MPIYLFHELAGLLIVFEGRTFFNVLCIKRVKNVLPSLGLLCCLWVVECGGQDTPLYTITVALFPGSAFYERYTVV